MIDRLLYYTKQNWGFNYEYGVRKKYTMQEDNLNKLDNNLSKISGKHSLNFGHKYKVYSNGSVRTSDLC